MQERVEVRLERGQLIWLTLGSVVLLAAMFALGMLVGRRAARLEGPAIAAADPIAQIDAAGDMHKELTFYSRLTEPARPAATPKPPPSEPAAAPAPIPAPSPAPAAEATDAIHAELAGGPARSGDYTVQVSSYQSLDEAKAYAAVLERKGYKPFVVTSTIEGKGTWYRVRLGSFKDEPTAQKAKTLLARADIPVWVLKSE